jgi:hypothetical protein
VAAGDLHEVSAALDGWTGGAPLRVSWRGDRKGRGGDDSGAEKSQSIHGQSIPEEPCAVIGHSSGSGHCFRQRE